MKDTIKTYDVTKRVGKQARKVILNCIEQHEKYSKSYFWSSGSSAGQRRRRETDFNLIHPCFTLLNGEDKVEVITSYSESCRNCYYKFRVYVNDEKKDIRSIKKLLK